MPDGCPGVCDSHSGLFHLLPDKIGVFSLSRIAKNGIPD
jgi:hypothetical protein